MEVTKSKEPTQGAKEEQKPALDSAIIDELMKGYQRPEDMTLPGGILEQLTKRVYERILGAEMVSRIAELLEEAQQLLNALPPHKLSEAEHKVLSQALRPAQVYLQAL
jgi:hypothetical protein